MRENRAFQSLKSAMCRQFFVNLWYNSEVFAIHKLFKIEYADEKNLVYAARLPFDSIV